MIVLKIEFSWVLRRHAYVIDDVTDDVTGDVITVECAMTNVKGITLMFCFSSFSTTHFNRLFIVVVLRLSWISLESLRSALSMS